MPSFAIVIRQAIQCLFRQFVSRDLRVDAYANKHYAGHGPGTVKLFWDTFSGQR